MRGLRTVSTVMKSLSCPKPSVTRRNTSDHLIQCSLLRREETGNLATGWESRPMVSSKHLHVIRNQCQNLYRPGFLQLVLSRQLPWRITLGKLGTAFAQCWATVSLHEYFLVDL
jgi:hypothetical protein